MDAQGALKNLVILHNAIVAGKATMDGINADAKAKTLLEAVRAHVAADPNVLIEDFAAGVFQPKVLFQIIGDLEQDARVVLALAFIERQHGVIVERLGADADVKSKATAVVAVESDAQLGHALRWTSSVVDQRHGDTLLLIQTAVLQGRYDSHIMFGLIRGSDAAGLIRRCRALAALFDRAEIPPSERRWDKGLTRSLIERLEKAGTVGDEGPSFAPEMTLLERLRAKREVMAATEVGIGWALGELKPWCGLEPTEGERVGTNGTTPRTAKAAPTAKPEPEPAPTPEPEPKSLVDELGLRNGD